MAKMKVRGHGLATPAPDRSTFRNKFLRLFGYRSTTLIPAPDKSTFRNKPIIEPNVAKPKESEFAEERLKKLNDTIQLLATKENLDMFGYEEAEHTLKEVFFVARETGKLNTDFVDKLVDILVLISNMRDINYGGWAHTVCHLFEKYAYNPGHSFLGYPTTFGFAKKLIDEMVKRGLAEDPITFESAFGCVERIIGPVREYNIDHIVELDGEFPFRPDSLTNPAFLRLLDELEASTGKDWIKKKIQNIKSFCGATTTRDLLGAQKAAVECMAANFDAAKNASEIVSGLYVDVDGTLLFGNGRINPFTIERMTAAVETGRVVKIFSDGDPHEQTERLRALGVDERFLPVLRKSDFRGKILEEVIDDTPPQYQGFRALCYYRNSSAKLW